MQKLSSAEYYLDNYLALCDSKSGRDKILANSWCYIRDINIVFCRCSKKSILLSFFSNLETSSGIKSTIFSYWSIVFVNVPYSSSDSTSLFNSYFISAIPNYCLLKLILMLCLYSIEGRIGTSFYASSGFHFWESSLFILSTIFMAVFSYSVISLFS